MLFPGLMGLSHESLMALHEAANWYGVDMDFKSAHRALYDAEITCELIRGVLTGEYKEVARNIHQYYNPLQKIDKQSPHGNCLGDLFGDVFRSFSINNQVEFSR